MSIPNKDLHNLVDRLGEQEKRTAYDFLRYLIDRQQNPYHNIDRLNPDDVPMNKEEQKQFDNEDTETISLEDLKRELKL